MISGMCQPYLCAQHGPRAAAARLRNFISSRVAPPSCEPPARGFVYLYVFSLLARITQAEGGEESDALMPALFSFAPCDLRADLRPNADARAFPDAAVNACHALLEASVG